MVWEQLVYGKLVESVAGPIVAGLDYRVTGISAAYPPDLVALSHPHRTGLNTSDLFNWQRYPWNDGGGLIVRSLVSQRGPMIMAGRVRGRPERGEGQSGRIYVQAHYAVTAVEQWNAAAIALLPNLLNATPMMAENRDMPRLRLDEAALGKWLGRPLDADWLDSIADPLAAVMSGVSFSIQDWQAPLDAFLQRSALCLCAVPRALAWRLSVGAGLAAMKGDVSLGLGQIAPRTGVRVIGAAVQGSDAPELVPGRLYVAWLRRHASAVRTAGELQSLIAELLPAFADPHAMSSQLDPGNLAQRIAASVKERMQLDALDVWLRTGEAPMPDTAFDLLRSDALQVLLRHLKPRGIEILPEFLKPDWSDAWQHAASEHTAAGSVAGAILRLAGASADAPAVGDVDYFVAQTLPPPLVSRFRVTLNKALRAHRIGADWAHQVQDQFARVPWLAGWFEESGEAWFWLAMEQMAQNVDDRLLRAVCSTRIAIAEALETLRWRDQPREYDAAAVTLAGSASKHQRSEMLSWLLDDLIERKRALAAVVLMDECVRLNMKTPVLPIFADPSRNGTERLVGLAHALASELDGALRIPSGPITLRLLAGTSPQPTLSTRLRDLLAGQLGNPIAQLLLGVADSEAPPRVDAEAENIAQFAFRNDPRLIDRLWSQLREVGDGNPVLERLLAKWLADERVLSSPETQTLSFVAHLFQGQSHLLPDKTWTEAEAQRIWRLLASKKSLVLTAVESAEELAQLSNGLKLVERTTRVVPGSRAVEKSIQSRLDHDGQVDPLLAKLKTWGWDRLAVWRLLFLPWTMLYRDDESNGADDMYSLLVNARKVLSRPAREEVELTDNLPYEQRLCLAAMGLPLRREQITESDSSIRAVAERLNSRILGDLARAAHDAGAMEIVGVVMNILLVRAFAMPEAGELLAAQLSRRALARFTQKLAGKELPPVVAAAQSVLRLLPDDQRHVIEEQISHRFAIE